MIHKNGSMLALSRKGAEKKRFKNLSVDSLCLSMNLCSTYVALLLIKRTCFAHLLQPPALHFHILFQFSRHFHPKNMEEMGVQEENLKVTTTTASHYVLTRIYDFLENIFSHLYKHRYTISYKLWKINE